MVITCVNSCSYVVFGDLCESQKGGLANHHTFPYFFCETFPKTPELHIRWKRLVDQVKSMCICLHLSLPAPWQLSVTSLSNISKICFFTNSRLHRELSRIIRSQTETRKWPGKCDTEPGDGSEADVQQKYNNGFFSKQVAPYIFKFLCPLFLSSERWSQ